MPTASQVLDVAVKDGRIVALMAPGTAEIEAERAVDAVGLYVLPGAIDPHVHIVSGPPSAPLPGFESASVAAAYGGTTTIMDFAHLAEGMTLAQSVEKRRAEVEGKSAIDYSLHVRISGSSHWSPARFSGTLIDQIGDGCDYGAPSFGEIYVAGDPDGDASAMRIFAKTAAGGGIVGVHAENIFLAQYFAKVLLDEGKTGVEHFANSRPNIVEAEAAQRAILFSEQTGAAVYFFHLSSREAVAAVAEAKAKGLPVYGETCPHYLAFNDEVYRGERAIEFVRFPPIRCAADQAALWDGVMDGTIDAIGTDHVAAFLWRKRELSKGKPFNELPGGMPQIENRVLFLYSEGVVKGRISINRLVDLVSTNPAKIFGLYPQKGVIAVGSDADIVVLDPSPTKRLTVADLHMNVDYTVFEGWIFTGEVALTISKGKVIIDKGRYTGSLSDGKFLTRKIGADILGKKRPRSAASY